MKRKWLGILVAVILISIIFWSSITLQTFFFDIVDFIAIFIEAHPVLGINIFILLSALAAILSPFSTAPFIPLVIPIWGPVLTIVFVSIGWLIGGLVAYMIGRFAGFHILTSFVKKEKLDKMKYYLDKDTGFWHVLLFRIVTPSEITSYLLGTIRYHFWKYFFATLVSEIIFAFLTIYISDSILEQNIYLFIALSLATATLIGVVYYLWHLANKKNGYKTKLRKASDNSKK
jgi:uncharacterized membrane protein YdjX (TVP38/TMEM64 family)